ncbi:MAG: tetratricopeptide repeat protein [Candidatus Arsenophonus melophagi]|nr:tetratricopeptide repeat protein [Candidatus Arsenophonus melophagi]
MRAQSNMATIYAHGLGVKRNLPEAASWFEQASKDGYALAEFNLGLMYSIGSGVIQDYKSCILVYKCCRTWIC